MTKDEIIEALRAGPFGAAGAFHMANAIAVHFNWKPEAKDLLNFALQVSPVAVGAAISLVGEVAPHLRPMLIQEPDGSWSTSMFRLEGDENDWSIEKDFHNPSIAILITLIDSLGDPS